jgi:hypothetical protein
MPRTPSVQPTSAMPADRLTLTEASGRGEAGQPMGAYGCSTITNPYSMCFAEDGD